MASSTATGNFPTITDTENSSVFSNADAGLHAGASGADQGGVKLSTGAIVGIAIALGVILAVFIVLWALWFTAKRRNWAVRDTLVYASRRLTGRRTVPPTPRTPHPVGRTRHFPSAGGAAVDEETFVERIYGPAPHRTKQHPTKSSMKPGPGWLTEKEASRSTTPDGPAPARR